MALTYRVPPRSRPPRRRGGHRGQLDRILAELNRSLEGLSSAALRPVLPVLAQAQAELVADLTRWLAQQDGASRYTTQRYRNSLLQVRRAMLTISRLHPEMYRGLVTAGRLGGQLSMANLEKEALRFGALFEGTIQPIAFDTAAIIARGEHLLIDRFRTSAARYAGSVRDNVVRELAVGRMRGETMDELATRLEKRLPQVFNRGRYDAERLARTETMHAYNTHHRLGVKEHAKTNPGTLQRWDGSPDSRVCRQCAALDGKIVGVEQEFEANWEVQRRAGPRPMTSRHEHPPAHPNCRCVLILWHEDWGDEWDGEADGDKISLPPDPSTAPPPPAAKPRRPARPRPPPPRLDESKMRDALPNIDAPAGYDPKRVKARERLNKSGKPIPDRLRTAPERAQEVVRGELRKAVEGELGLAWSKPIPKPRWQYTSNSMAEGRKMLLVRKMPGNVAGTNNTATNTISITPTTKKGAVRFLTKERPYAKDALDFHALVHEEVHSAGLHLLGRATGTHAYSGAGVLVEEIATELSARRYMRTRFGARLVSSAGRVSRVEAFFQPQGFSGGRGAYQRFIDGVVTSTRKRLGLTEAAAYELIDDTAIRFKRLRGKADTADDMKKHWLRALDPDRSFTAKQRRELARDLDALAALLVP